MRDAGNFATACRSGGRCTLEPDAHHNLPCRLRLLARCVALGGRQLLPLTADDGRGATSLVCAVLRDGRGQLDLLRSPCVWHPSGLGRPNAPLVSVRRQGVLADDWPPTQGQRSRERATSPPSWRRARERSRRDGTSTFPARSPRSVLWMVPGRTRAVGASPKAELYPVPTGPVGWLLVSGPRLSRLPPRASA